MSSRFLYPERKREGGFITGFNTLNIKKQKKKRMKKKRTQQKQEEEEEEEEREITHRAQKRMSEGGEEEDKETTISFIVKTSTNPKLEMKNIKLTKLIAELKADLATTLGSEKRSIRLIYKGHVLKDEKTIKSVRLGKGTRCIWCNRRRRNHHLLRAGEVVVVLRRVTVKVVVVGNRHRRERGWTTRTRVKERRKRRILRRCLTAAF